MEDLFSRIEKIPQNKPEYINACRFHLELGGYEPSDRLKAAAGRALDRRGTFDPEWLSKELAAFLFEGKLKSPEWSKERIDHLCDILPDYAGHLSLGDYLSSPGFKGVPYHLALYPEDLSRIREAYHKYIESQFSDLERDHRPYALYYDLILTKDEAYFQSPVFKDQRDRALKNKLENGEVSGLSKFLAYYERDVANPLEFNETELIALKKLSPYAEDVVLECFRSGTSEGFKEAHLMMNTIMTKEFISSEYLYKAVIRGVITNFKQNENAEGAAALLSDFSEVERALLWGRICKAIPEIAKNNISPQEKDDVLSDVYDIGVPALPSLMRQSKLVRFLEKEGDYERASEQAFAAYNMVEGYTHLHRYVAGLKYIFEKIYRESRKKLEEKSI